MVEAFLRALERADGHLAETPIAAILQFIVWTQLEPHLTFQLTRQAFLVRRIDPDELSMLCKAVEIQMGVAYCFKVLDCVWLAGRGVDYYTSANAGASICRRRSRTAFPTLPETLAGLMSFWSARQLAMYLEHFRNSPGCRYVEDLVAELAQWVPFVDVVPALQPLPDALVVEVLRLLITRQRLGPNASASYVATAVSTWSPPRRGWLVRKITIGWTSGRKTQFLERLAKIQ